MIPEWLLERRRRAEAARTSVVATCYLLGVSTRPMDKLVQSLGITGLSRTPTSRTSGLDHWTLAPTRSWLPTP